MPLHADYFFVRMHGGFVVRSATVVAAIVALLASATPVPAAAETTSAPSPRSLGTFDNDHLIVRFRPGVSSADVKAVKQKYKIGFSGDLDRNTDLYWITGTKSSDQVVKDLKKDSRIELAELDYDLHSSAITNDSSISNLWGLDNYGQTVNGQTGTVGVDINAADAWGTTTGSDVVVAVLDEGVDINHPELASNIWTNDDCFNDGIDHDNNGYVNDCHGWDFFHGDKTVYDPADGEDHGTHVAGTIGALKNNGTGVAGVAPNVKIMPLKFLGPTGGSTSDAITAIAYAKANGARIVNCSWGGTGYSQALKDAMANSGLLFTTAAGNNGENITVSPEYPAAYNLPNQITVAAVDNQGRLASFSNFGGTTAVAAPGSDIYSTIPKLPEAAVAVDNTPSSNNWRTSYFGFGLEDADGADTRRDILAAELGRFGANPSSPILLVDDDESSSGSGATPATEQFYVDALNAAGYSNISTFDVTKNANGPLAGAMAGKIVIWETGYAIGSADFKTLTSSDLAALQSFLDGDGLLMLFGSDAIWRNENTALVTNYLGLSQVDEGDDRSVASGVPGGPLDGMSVSLTGADSPRGSRNEYSDIVVPRMSSAEATLTVGAAPDWTDAYGYKSGTSMAAPHVAGVAALVAAVLPNASAEVVAGHVKGSTRYLSSLNGKTTTAGLVDAARAVQSAQGITIVPEVPPAPVVTPPSTPSTPSNVAATAAAGYRFVAADGGIFSFGGSSFAGSTGGQKLNEPVVGIGAKPDGSGYWLVARDGGIFGFKAPFFGSAGGTKLNQPIVGMAVTPTGNGYWLVASDGGIFSYGDAKFYGSTGAIKLNKPIVAMSATPSGQGYWLTASDGGIFAYGDAKFYGSTGAMSLNKPIVGMASTPSGKGYWLVASDGGIFSYGDAKFYGSTGAMKLNKEIVGITSSPTGLGYWLVASDGGIFSYGDAGFFGSTGAMKLNQPIVAMSR